MALLVYLQSAFLAIVIAVTSAMNDYKSFRQPIMYQSDCAKQITKLSTDSSSSGMGDRPTAMIEAGELRINLVVQVTRFTSDYVDFNTRSYSGHIPAPTIKVCPGDRLVVTVTNSLEGGKSNNTNLHLHGMHLPPVGNADNVMPDVVPGGQRIYSYDIRQDHPAGTFWYHSHTHGNVNSHLQGMMAGALIVVDRLNDFPTELAAMEDLIVILQAFCIENCSNKHDDLQEAIENKYSHSRKVSDQKDDDKVWDTDLEVVENEADAPLNDTSLLTVFANGQYLPKLNFVAGEYKRMRLINAIANNVAELVTTYGSGCMLEVIAMDGIYYTRPKAKEVIVLPPGGRADVAIICTEIGTFYLETDCASSRNKLLGLVNQHRVPSQRIVQFNVVEREMNDLDIDLDITANFMHLPSVLPKRPAYMEDTIGTSKSHPLIEKDRQYAFEFSVWMENDIVFGVNHETLNISNINHSMRVNEVQEWELSVTDYRKESLWNCNLDDNATPATGHLSSSSNCHTMNHPFHMHSTHFQISNMDDITDPDGVLFDLGDWRDTLPLFRGGVQIRFTPRDYMVGNLFAHCHIASHADGGMAQLVNVYDSETRMWVRPLMTKMKRKVPP
ncbi:hypothetical protein F443_06937 [Plasmopara halstedii]|uniref:Multicopper oxidase n=1 Tax=Plasmopara halstedii TaxID=4781 RepID=A0A0N7L8B1_PLAHL|nr:hypothetical protein F443_06937 [Plasmopara halstedii]CEG49379.1 hypothetical protein F443_06937 [Plasmopara halstedii]|eukprot:XP_024585748.1 hypothetical protein F443_06937 [Plasmopara halstedii]